MTLNELLKKNKINIILASKSLRRQMLLKELGVDFKIIVKEVDEIYPSKLQKEEIPLFLSKLKASVFNNINKNDIIITSDTIVCIKDKVLGKPVDYNDAVAMLNNLSGNKHTVYTGVCIKSATKQIVFSDKTDVYFKKLNNSEIKYYIETYKPYDKAGAYGIQEWIGYVAIDKIEGSYFNVMGLPVHKLYSELYKFLG